MRSIRTLLVGLLLTAICVTAGAEWREQPEMGVAYWVPDEWPCRMDGDVTELVSPDEAVRVRYMIIHASEVDPALRLFEQEIGEVLRDVEITEQPRVRTVRGMEMVVARGVGLLGREPADWLMAVVFHNDRALLAYGYGVRELLAPHRDAIEMMLRAIRPVAAEGEEIQEWFTLEQMKLEFWIPASWPRFFSDDVTEVRSPEGAVRIRYRVIPETDVDQALEAFKQEIGAVLTEVEMTSHPEVSVVNGMEVVKAAGTGLLHGEQARWMVAIVFHEGRALMAYGVALQELLEEHRPAIEEMFRRIRATD